MWNFAVQGMHKFMHNVTNPLAAPNSLSMFVIFYKNVLTLAQSKNPVLDYLQ